MNAGKWICWSCLGIVRLAQVYIGTGWLWFATGCGWSGTDWGDNIFGDVLAILNLLGLVSTGWNRLQLGGTC